MSRSKSILQIALIEWRKRKRKRGGVNGSKGLTISWCASKMQEEKQLLDTHSTPKGSPSFACTEAEVLVWGCSHQALIVIPWIFAHVWVQPRKESTRNFRMSVWIFLDSKQILTSIAQCQFTFLIIALSLCLSDLLQFAQFVSKISML